MPIYEYQCQSCGHVFDALQKMSDDKLTDCPECNKPELRKLVSAPNFRLKGSGWYETDFKDKNKRNLADGAGSAAESSTGKKTDKSDTTKKVAKDSAKPAAKESKPASKSSGSSSAAD